MSRDSRDLQWCYWRGELVLARKEERGWREFVVHGSHWWSGFASELIDEEAAVNGEVMAEVNTAINARVTMKRLLRVVGLTVKS